VSINRAEPDAMAARLALALDASGRLDQAA